MLFTGKNITFPLLIELFFNNDCNVLYRKIISLALALGDNTDKVALLHEACTALAEVAAGEEGD